MALHDEVGVGRPVHLSRDEHAFLARAVVECGLLEEYSEMLANILGVALRWRFGASDIPAEVAVREALSILNTQNRVLDFEVRVNGPAVLASFSTPSPHVGEVIAASITKLLTSMGRKARTRSAGSTVLIEVRPA